ncbi:MAG: citrate transporter [Eubacterium sp.]|nr:citrate transporter [Eubacterium sp.]
MKFVLEYIKKETVLTVSWILAVISAFIVPPSGVYLDYIDFRTLGILWSLMVIVAGLKENGLFMRIAQICIRYADHIWKLFAVLIFMPFFFSMFITNDVALLTFVPFALYVLKVTKREEYIIPVVVLQTLAANLGSMLTPIGNPQNLYLYTESNLGIVEFICLMLPYSAASVVGLLVCVAVMTAKNIKNGSTNRLEMDPESIPCNSTKVSSGVYGVLFLFAVLVVVFSVNYIILVVAVLCSFLVLNREILKKIDYALLFTFVGFFIFTGNLGRMSAIKDILTSMVCGNEVFAGIIASQMISNVPAALLLADFTDDIKSLIIGVDLGGLGTLIASMASLISFKLLAHNYNEIKGRYFIIFTLMNVVFLAMLIGVYYFTLWIV